jgi:hypothetical protein
MDNISNVLNFGVGDIITLSDIQTQTEFKKLDVDFTIVETREYKHPEGVFCYTGYIAVYQASPDAEQQQIMLVVRQVGDQYDLRVYYMDSDGPADIFEGLFVKEEDDLVDRFEVTLHFDEDHLDVTWDRQGVTNFGIECRSSASKDVNCKTIASYFTNDDTRGNPHCFIEWTGDKIGGYIEIWYGCEIRKNDLEMYHTKELRRL